MKLENTIVLLLDDMISCLEESKIAISEFVKEENIVCASSAVEAMRIIESRPIDLAFLDVEMPMTNGFSMAKYISKKQPKIKYVFLTGHSELGAESYDYEPLDFLCKPIDIIRLRKTFERYEMATQKKDFNSDMVAIDTNAGFILLSPYKINYISKENRKTLIHCSDQVYQVQYSLEELGIIFSEYGIFRTHQSFLVTLNRIVRVEQADFGKTYTAILDGGKKVPVSRNQYGKLREHLANSGIRFM